MPAYFFQIKKSIVLCGDGADIDLLMQEGVSEADVVICTTKDERLNLLVALLARHLGAKRQSSASSAGNTRIS